MKSKDSTLIAIFDNPMEMKDAQDAGDEQFSHQNHPKPRFRMLQTRPVACHCSCSINIYKDERVETEVRQKIGRKPVETAGGEITLEEEVEIIFEHPFGKVDQRQQTVRERQQGQIGEGRVTA